MNSTKRVGNDITLKLSNQQALVFFEWLSRNWEKSNWNDSELFVHPTERQLLIWIENSLSSKLDSVFDSNYKVLIECAYKDLSTENDD